MADRQPATKEQRHAWTLRGVLRANLGRASILLCSFLHNGPEAASLAADKDWRFILLAKRSTFHFDTIFET